MKSTSLRNRASLSSHRPLPPLPIDPAPTSDLPAIPNPSPRGINKQTNASLSTSSIPQRKPSNRVNTLNGRVEQNRDRNTSKSPILIPRILSEPLLDITQNDAHWEAVSDPKNSPRDKGFTDLLKATIHRNNTVTNVRRSNPRNLPARNPSSASIALSLPHPKSPRTLKNTPSAERALTKSPSRNVAATMRELTPSRRNSEASENDQKNLRRVKSEEFLHSWDMFRTVTKKKLPKIEAVTSGSSGTDSPSTRKKHENLAVEEYVKEVEQSTRKLTKNKISMKNIIDQNMMTLETNGKVQIVSGTKEKLVEYLTVEDVSEDFLRVFLLSYRYFASPSELFELLMKRFDQPPTDVTDQKTAKKIQKVIQLRVIVFMKVWMESHFSDIFFDKALQDDIFTFCSTTLKNSKHKNWSKLLKSTMERKIADEYMVDVRSLTELLTSQSNFVTSTSKSKDKHDKFGSISFKGADALDFITSQLRVQDDDAVELVNRMTQQKYIKPVQKSKSKEGGSFTSIFPSSSSSSSSSSKKASKNQVFVISTSEGKHKSLLDFKPSDIARQLTSIEFSLLRAIRLQELSSTNFSRKNKQELCPNVLKMIEQSNSVGYWVSSEIVTTANLKKRVAVLKQFISIAQHCHKLHNFNGLFEVMGGLNNGAIRRLKDTWRELNSKVLEVFIHLDELCSTDENYKLYRTMIKSTKASEVPGVPYLGVYLKDLTACEDVTDPTFTKNGQVNFKKMQVVAPILEELKAYQENPYTDLEFNSEVQSFLLHGRSYLTEKELYTKSKFIEPPVKFNASKNRKWF